MEIRGCNSCFYLWGKKVLSAQLAHSWQRLEVTDLFLVEISLVVTGHVLCHGEEAHLEGNGPLDYFFQSVFSMAAKLAGMAVHGERHL